jgi:DNA-binding PadR family transcriptional regulator
MHHDRGRGDADFGLGPGFGGHGGRGFGMPFPPGFGPRGGRRAGRGDVRAMILSLLSTQSLSGYGIIQAANERTGGAWRPSPGSVYPTLQQLVDEELLEQTGTGRRTEYTLTDEGRTYVQEHADELERAWESAPGRSEGSDALMMSTRKLMGVVAQLNMVGTEEQRADATAKIDELRKALYLILAE